jgi:hypothetical protein
MKTITVSLVVCTLLCVGLSAQETEKIYLSGKGTDDAVMWDFYCTATLAPFPSGNLSILNAISPVGTKFMKAAEHGPQSQQNNFVSAGHTMPLTGKILMKIE